ncbi:MAG: MoaD/ThiS family protein [Pseudomonadota bacterium]
MSATRLDDILAELGYGEAKIATAVNEDFVAIALRTQTFLTEHDRLEIVAPQQGG